ncbi:MFS transporter [Micromonospora sp. LZ34]
MTLLRNRPFLRLWTAQSISDLGSYLSLVALPLVAIAQLDASATQMGLLVGAGMAPMAFAWPFFGVLVDRVDRRRVIVATYLGRALLYAWIPAAALLDVLTITQLIVVYFLANLLQVAFDVAYPTLVPSLVKAPDLLEANSKLEVTRSAAMIVGPAAAGLLVQILRPAGTVALDAASYALAGLLVLAIEPPLRGAARSAAPPRRGVVGEMTEGITAVFGNALLRPMALSSGLMNAGYALRTALFVMFVVKQLGFTAGELGLILAAAGPGALLGALLARRAAQVLGFGRTMIVSAFLAGAPRPARTRRTCSRTDQSDGADPQCVDGRLRRADLQRHPRRRPAGNDARPPSRPDQRHIPLGGLGGDTIRGRCRRATQPPVGRPRCHRGGRRRSPVTDHLPAGLPHPPHRHPARVVLHPRPGTAH